MMRTTRHELSFSSVAYKIGAISVDDLRAVYAISEACGLTLEAVLVEQLDDDVVSFIRDAQSLAQVSCEHCGGRVSRSVSRLDFPCRCSTPGLQHQAA